MTLAPGSNSDSSNQFLLEKPLLIMISLTGFETGFSTNVLNLLIIAVIAVINIIFLGFLQIKQPTY